jgi:protein involved in polysaccharide export with SLBB domain
MTVLMPRLDPTASSDPDESANISGSRKDIMAQDNGTPAISAPTNAATSAPLPGEEDRFTGLAIDYVLGPGDQISVIDPSLGTLDTPATSINRIAPDGTVTVYPIGVIRAAGLTIPQLNELVNKKASEFIKNPHISVSLLKARPVTIYVLGDVVSPGLWSTEQQSAIDRERQTAQSQALQQQYNNYSVVQNRSSRFLGIGRAGGAAQPQADITQQTAALPSSTEPEPGVTTVTALTAIQLAGGVRETADIRSITVRKRGSGKVYNVDLWKLLAMGDFQQDVLLQSGDVVFVPTGGTEFAADKLGYAANQFRTVRVWGEVRNPGLYTLTPKDDAFSIIARAGGFTEKADLRKFDLGRVDRNGQVHFWTIPTRLAMAGAIPPARSKVMPNDVIFARPSYLKKAGPKVYESIAVLAGGVLLLYLSRNIVDRSNPNGTTGTSTVRLF